MSESEKYMIWVCETLIDDEINDRRRPKGWFSVLDLMRGVSELKERARREDTDE